jgi:ribosomal protein S13
MARIAGINIPTHKHIVIGLQSIFGIDEKLATSMQLSSSLITSYLKYYWSVVIKLSNYPISSLIQAHVFADQGMQY